MQCAKQRIAEQSSFLPAMATFVDLFIFRSSLHLFLTFHSSPSFLFYLLSSCLLVWSTTSECISGVFFVVCIVPGATLYDSHINRSTISLFPPIDSSAPPFMVCDSRHFPALQPCSFDKQTNHRLSTFSPEIPASLSSPQNGLQSTKAKASRSPSTRCSNIPSFLADQRRNRESIMLVCRGSRSRPHPTIRFLVQSDQTKGREAGGSSSANIVLGFIPSRS